MSKMGGPGSGRCACVRLCLSSEQWTNGRRLSSCSRDGPWCNERTTEAWADRNDFWGPFRSFQECIQGVAIQNGPEWSVIYENFLRRAARLRALVSCVLVGEFGEPSRREAVPQLVGGHKY